MTVDQAKLEELLGRFVTDLGATLHATNAVIGNKLGLYRQLHAIGPCTPAELADRVGTAEPYMRDWLRGQAAGGYVTHDPDGDRYALSEEQAFALADEHGLHMPWAFQLAASTAKDEPQLTEAIRTGTGFGWHQHHPDMFQGTEAFFRPGYAANLVSSWIPALDGVEAKLRQGARVADVGCGHGASTLLMAEAFPRSTFVGFDNHPESIDRSRKVADDTGLNSRVTFEVAQAKSYPGTGYDLVTVFDALHDMGDPVGAAAHVLETLAPDGTWLLVEPNAHDRVEDNLNPVGRLFYSAATLACLPHSLSEEVGAALGPQAGEAKLREVATTAGFTRFRRAAETPFNQVLELRP